MQIHLNLFSEYHLKKISKYKLRIKKLRINIIIKDYTQITKEIIDENFQIYETDFQNNKYCSFQIYICCSFFPF